MPSRSRATPADSTRGGRGDRAGHAEHAEHADKTCRSCGRRIEWRKKWERNWDDIAYCSDACRNRRVSAADLDLEAGIRNLLANRAATATICPSDVARAVTSDETEWRALMEPVRRAARRMVAAGEVEITQGGSVVDPSTAKGPIRIRRKRS